MKTTTTDTRPTQILKWNRSSDGATGSKCGRFFVQREYKHIHGSVTDYILVDARGTTHDGFGTQADAKAAANRIVSAERDATASRIVATETAPSCPAVAEEPAYNAADEVSEVIDDTIEVAMPCGGMPTLVKVPKTGACLDASAEAWLSLATG